MLASRLRVMGAPWLWLCMLLCLDTSSSHARLSEPTNLEPWSLEARVNPMMVPFQSLLDRVPHALAADNKGQMRWNIHPVLTASSWEVLLQLRGGESSDLERVEEDELDQWAMRDDFSREDDLAGGDDGEINELNKVAERMRIGSPGPQTSEMESLGPPDSQLSSSTFEPDGVGRASNNETAQEEIPAWNVFVKKLGPQAEELLDSIQRNGDSPDALRQLVRDYGGDWTAIEHLNGMSMKLQFDTDLVETWAETIDEARERRDPLSHVDAQKEFGIDLDQYYSHISVVDAVSAELTSAVQPEDEKKAGIESQEVMQNWELAGGIDAQGQQTTFFRNKCYGYIVELNHVESSTFGIMDSMKRVVTVIGGGIWLQHDDSDHSKPAWSCPLIPEAFEQANKEDRLSGHGSAQNYTFNRTQHLRSPGDETTAQLPESLDQILVWPRSPEAVSLMAKLALHGLVLRDAPIACKPEFMRGFVEAVPEDVDLPMFDPKAASPLHVKPFHNEGWEVKVQNGAIKIRHHDDPAVELWLGKDFIIMAAAEDALNDYQGIGLIIEAEEPLRQLSFQEVQSELKQRGFEYIPQDCSAWAPIDEDPLYTAEEAMVKPEVMPYFRPNPDCAEDVEERFLKYKHMDDPTEQAAQEIFWFLQQQLAPPATAWDFRQQRPYDPKLKDRRSDMNKEIAEALRTEKEEWRRARKELEQQALKHGNDPGSTINLS